MRALRQMSESRRSALDASIESATTILLVAGAVILLLMFAGTALIARSVMNPLGRLHDATLRLAGGGLETAMPDTGRQDELGAMARAMETFRGGLLEAQRLRDERDALEAAAAQNRSAMLNEVAGEFEDRVGRIVSSVSAAVEQVSSAAASLSATIEESSVEARSVSAAAEDASANTSAIAAATQQVSQSIQSVSETVERASRITGQVAGDAGGMTTAMAHLRTTAENVAGVIEIINNVSAQTNLLALNATIEAARAGEHGKGFAVVASEVKILAARTAEATSEISKRIAEMQATMNSADAAAGGIARTVAEMQQLSSLIASAMTEQSATAQDIARNTSLARRAPRSRGAACVIWPKRRPRRVLPARSWSASPSISAARPPTSRKRSRPS